MTEIQDHPTTTSVEEVEPLLCKEDQNHKRAFSSSNIGGMGTRSGSIELVGDPENEMRNASDATVGGKPRYVVHSNETPVYHETQSETTPQLPSTEDMEPLNPQSTQSKPVQHFELTPLKNKTDGSTDQGKDSEEKAQHLTDEQSLSPASHSGRPEACNKAIKNLGMRHGSLRSLVLKSMNLRPVGPVLPDPNESVSEESLMVQCTPAMIKALSDDTTSAADLEREGIGLSQVLRRIRDSEDPDTVALLNREVSRATVRRRRQSNTPDATSQSIEAIRKNYQERSYQRMIGQEVGSGVNALRIRTENRYKDQLVIELRQSLSLAVSALFVFVASFLIGFYVPYYLAGVHDFHQRLLYGVITAALGGILEAILMALSFAHLDQKQHRLRVSRRKAAKAAGKQKTS